jgi:NAD(P)-dependent dehydrogenase (short-subunit alcohol dehydrogenase family)
MSEDIQSRQLAVVSGSSGIGFGMAQQALAGGGSPVITGQNPDELRMALKAPAQHVTAWGTAADLTDLAQAPKARRQLAAMHTDATGLN